MRHQGFSGHHHGGGCGHREHAIHTMRGEFGGPARGGPGGRGGRGERRRMFEGGELRLVLLKLIEVQPRHGYDLIREIETLTGGAYAPSPGVVYPTMTLLNDMGLAEERLSEGARKVLGITQAGEAHLAERASEVEGVMARLTALGKINERTESAPVRRAMQNLKTVLHDRLSDDAADREFQLKVAALLDEATAKIERL